MTKWKPGGRKSVSHWLNGGRAFQARGYCKCEALVCSRFSKKTNKTGKEWAAGSAVGDKVREVSEVSGESPVEKGAGFNHRGHCKLVSNFGFYSKWDNMPLEGLKQRGGICFVKKMTEVRQEAEAGRPVRML